MERNAIERTAGGVAAAGVAGRLGRGMRRLELAAAAGQQTAWAREQVGISRLVEQALAAGVVAGAGRGGERWVVVDRRGQPEMPRTGLAFTGREACWCYFIGMGSPDGRLVVRTAPHPVRQEAATV